jgi:hypothetical protein
MKKALIIVLAICFVGGAANLAGATSVSSPLVAYTTSTGKEPVFIDTTMVEIDGKTAYAVSNYTNQTSDYAISLDALLIPEPSISFGISASNFTANPIIFTFFFATPVTIGGVPTLTAASIVGGLTDTTGDGVGVAPAAAAVLQVNYVDYQNSNSTPTIGVGDLVQFGPGAPGSFYAYGPFSAGPAAGPTGPWDTFSTVLSFALTGNGDIAALTGYCAVTPVPLPGTLLLLGSGLLFLVNRRRS